MTSTLDELRSALHKLAEQAPSVHDLDHRSWSYATGSGPRARRRRPTGRVLATIGSAVTVLVVLVVIGVVVLSRDTASSPADGGAAVLEVRPMLASAVPVSSAGPHSPDPLQGLPFDVPGTEAAFDQLTIAQQQHLLAALATTDCGAQLPSDVSTRVACDRGVEGQQFAYLLGPSIFGVDNIISADAVAPSVPGGSAQWTIAIAIDSQAAAALLNYTTAHRMSEPDSVAATECGPGSAPCADFIAFLVDGQVLSVPAIAAPLSSSVQVSGNFTEQRATTLAHELVP